MKVSRRHFFTSWKTKLENRDEEPIKLKPLIEEPAREESLSRVEVKCLKGFKLSLAKDRSLRKGVAVRSFEELKLKARQKFELNEVALFLSDGTEIDDEDYFQSLKSQTLLVVASNRQEIENNRDFSFAIPSGPFQRFLEALRRSNDAEKTFMEIQNFFAENREEKIQKLSEIVRSKSFGKDSRILSHRNEDLNWFKDISTNATTKEEYMRKSCQSRMRGYLAKAESQLRGAKLCEAGQAQVREILVDFRTKLKENKYNGSYFDRSASGDLRICDSCGTFKCEGKYDAESCDKIDAHAINPYESAESRILFSTWNLDHVIERSRSIVPGLISAIRELKNLEDEQKTNKRRRIQRNHAKEVNRDYFYDLLFTRKNLKLVHIVCHDKQEHKKRKCQKELFFVRKT